MATSASRTDKPSSKIELARFVGITCNLRGVCAPPRVSGAGVFATRARMHPLPSCMHVHWHHTKRIMQCIFHAQLLPLPSFRVNISKKPGDGKGKPGLLSAHADKPLVPLAVPLPGQAAAKVRGRLRSHMLTVSQFARSCSAYTSDSETCLHACHLLFICIL